MVISGEQSLQLSTGTIHNLLVKKKSWVLMALAKLLSLEDFISFSLFKKGKGKFNKQTLYRN